MKKLYNILFNHKQQDEEFNKVQEDLKTFKTKLLADFTKKGDEDSPTSPINDVDFIKNEWVTLPEAFGKGVLSMGIEESTKRKCFLVHYSPDSEIFTHKHPHNIERIQVLTGFIKDNENGEVYNEGETYIIDKNVPHNIITLHEEAYLFIVFSEKLESMDIKHAIE